MQKKIRLLALVAAAVLGLGSAAWGQDLYVVAGGGHVGTKITTLPYTISTPGFYFLGGNLTYTGTGNAITVSANNVTLDLMGFSLTNSGAAGSTNGIYMYGLTNVEIRNGAVSGFKVGVNEAGSGNKHRIINIRATNTYGIALGGTNHLIKDCSASNNTTTGLELDGSGLIVDCVANDNGSAGIVLLGPGSVLGNTACGNPTYNFYLGNGVPTSILADGNSAFGLSPNYFNNASPPAGLVITANNSGTP